MPRTQRDAVKNGRWVESATEKGKPALEGHFSTSEQANGVYHILHDKGIKHAKLDIKIHDIDAGDIVLVVRGIKAVTTFTEHYPDIEIFRERPADKMHPQELETMSSFIERGDFKGLAEALARDGKESGRGR